MNILVIMGKNKIGMLRTIRGIDKNLSEKGHHFSYLFPENKFIDDLGFDKNKINIVKGMSSLRKFPEVIRGLYGLLKGWKAIKDGHIDLIYNYTVSTLPYCILLSKISGTPYITAVRNVYKRNDKAFKKYALHKAKNILAVSADTMRHVEEFVGNRTIIQNKRVVHNAIDLKYFEQFIDCPRPDEYADFKADDVIIGMVSAMNPEKDPKFLLRVAQRVVEKCPSAKFLFLGSFPGKNYEKETLELRDSLSLQNNAFFLGFKNPVGPYFAHMNMLAHPTSRDEPFGLVLAEAMFFGSPVVGSRVGAIPEIVINGETGIICDPGDEEAFAIAIIKLVKNRELLERMGEKAAKVVREKFSMKRLGTDLDSLFKKVIETWDKV